MMSLSDVVFTFTQIAEWIAIASLKSIPLILIVLLLQRVFRPVLSAAATHFLWLSVLLSLSVPFGWQLSITEKPLTSSIDSVATAPSTVMPSEQTANENIPIEFIAVSANEITNDKPLSEPTSNQFYNFIIDNLKLLLASVWLLGVVALSTLTFMRWRYFSKLCDTAEPVTNDTLKVFYQVKKSLGVKKTIALIISHDLQSPISLGWFNPSIILPQNIEQQLSSEQIKHVLLHELGHIKRNDILVNWFACIMNIVHWFNPLVWIAFRKMRQDMEVACDALVLQHLQHQERKDYGTTLITISDLPQLTPKANFNLGILENHSELKERLMMIKEFTMTNTKQTVLFGFLLAITALTALAQPATQITQQPSDNNQGFNVKSDDQLKSERKNQETKDNTNTSLNEFVERASKSLNKKIMVDKKLLNLRIYEYQNELPKSYGQLLSQLILNGFTAYKLKNDIYVIDIRDARDSPIPTVEKNKTYYDDEFVHDTVALKMACGSQLLPAVRPLVPQWAGLTISTDNRSMHIVDTYSNSKRIKTLIKTIDASLDKRQDCSPIDVSN